VDTDLDTTPVTKAVTSETKDQRLIPTCQARDITQLERAALFEQR